jgi:hypothetical protein
MDSLYLWGLLRTLIQVLGLLMLIRGLQYWYRHYGPFGPIGHPPSEPPNDWRDWILFYGGPFLIRFLILGLIIVVIINTILRLLGLNEPIGSIEDHDIREWLTSINLIRFTF